MATRKKPTSDDPPTSRIIDGHVHEPVFHYRFLMGNGDIVDIHSHTVDSSISELILADRAIDGDRIVGVARMEFVGYTRLHLIEPGQEAEDG